MSGMREKITNGRLLAVGGILVGLFIAGSVWWWIQSGRVVSTDDARVKGTMTTVSAKVTGRIAEIMVKEGDQVEAGQVLAVVEKQEYENKVAEARANLALAQAKLAEAVTGNRPQEIAQAKVRVVQEKALYENRQRDYARDQALYAQAAISEQQLDAARTQMESAFAQYQAAEEAYSLSQEGARKETIAEQEAAVAQAQAALENARIALADAAVKAPSKGTIGQKSAELGEFVAAGKPLFSITNLEDVWIGANIEETDIGKIALGNRVEFTVDAYSGVAFGGEVIETGPATGAQYALLPTENTAGNFTKVTQRLPIKIQPDASSYVLKPGMSAVIKIHVK